MSSDPVDPVREQYERYPYPEPVRDLSTVEWSSPFDHVKDLSELYWNLWPTAPVKRLDLDILIPGCGTNLAASYAYRFPDARVVGIDISATSLAHERFLKQQHKLDNLELHELPLERAGELGKQFDYICVSGVLHHLTDPVAGLAALRDVLRPDGVMNIMVYGQIGRMAVYMVQDLFRQFGLTPTSDALAVVKETLRIVSPTHPIRPYLTTPDLRSDAGVIDTFLHPRDVSYTVEGCLKLARDAAVAFMGWQEPILYRPDIQVPAGSKLRAQIDRLPEPAQWAAMERIHGQLTLHAFHACRQDRDPGTYRLDVMSDALLDFVPVVRERMKVTRHRGSVTIELPPFARIPLDPLRSALFEAIDGHRTVRQCFDAAPVNLTEPGKREVFWGLWRIGYLLLRKPPNASER